MSKENDDRLMREFKDANPCTQATIKALLGIGLLLRNPDVALASRMDFAKELLKAYSAAVQFDTIRIYKEGRDRFAEMPEIILQSRMASMYFSMEQEATEKLAILASLFKEFEGVDVQKMKREVEQEMEKEHGTQNAN